MSNKKLPPDDPGVLDQIDQAADTWLIKVAKSKWSAFWLLGFWLTGYLAGQFHLNFLVWILELFWWIL